MHLTHRSSCRVCASTSLTRVIDLGEQFLQGSFIKPGEKNPPLRKIATTLARCNPMIDEKACGLLQMEHTVPPQILYSSYWYRSGTNATMRNHLKGIAEKAAGFIKKNNARVLDIGCNDGTLLSNYPKDFTKYGVDPSDVAQEIGNEVTVIQDTFPSKELTKVIKAEYFDIITSIAMFYDLEDPVSFTKEIKKVLSPEGIWISEMSYMPLMLKMNSYDTICHEHLEYYSLAVIENILKRADMKVIDVELNNINGGSLRFYATHNDNFKYKNDEAYDRLTDFRQEEFDLALDTNEPYSSFQDRINVHKYELITVLKNLKKDGKKIHIYGASTKGNTILQWCGIDRRLIEFAAERNPDKYGAFTLGTDIPIISEEESRKLEPDYYLVLPWHFKEEFLERERKTLEAGASFIFPLPKIEVVTA